MPNAVIESVRCSCGTLLPPVEVRDPFTGEVRYLQAWPVKGCPVCQERARKAEAERTANPPHLRGRDTAKPRVGAKHFGLYEYPD